MYPLPPVDPSQVLRLLDEGRSQQRVANQTGISRRTVGRIVAGVHANAHEFTRCTGCGGKQVMPCRVCAHRAAA